MIVYKRTIVLSCLLLIGHHATAVVNKSSSQGVNGNNKEEIKKNEIKADDRISNSYGPPADDYGPPLDSPNFNRPPPVYGPPEITGNLEPSPIYPPPPPELPPPPIHGPPSLSYGPPRSPKPVYGPPKQSHGPPLSLPPKLNFGPPKSHHGFPKAQYGAPPFGSFGSFRPPKPQYGPPKFGGSLSSSYLPAIPISTQYGRPKGNHGPSIPLSLESYGPPPSDGFAVQFGPSPSNEYGAPQPQYGAPVADSYGPPPPGPPPGVPAPPTPPDIKYDGWQPIAGAAPNNNHDTVPQDTYGPPSNGLSNDFISTPSHSSSSSSLATDPNIPSDSYGVPILSKEAQNLKQSVHQPSSATENDGLPPPPLPQYDPLYNQSPPRIESSAKFAPNVQQTPHAEYGVPKVEPVSIVKTVGFELLPTSGSSSSDLQSSSLSNSGGSHGHSLGSGIGGAGIQDFSFGQNNIGYDIPLPQFPVQTPSNDYGPPLGGSHGIVSGLPIPPPPVDSYGAPSLPSFSGGSYSPPHTPRGGPSFASFGLFTSSYLKHGSHHSRHGPFRHGPPLPPVGSMIPPRNREPIKFREPIPTGILSMINRYLPPSKSSKSHGSSHLSLNQQLPTISGPLSFHHSPGRSGSYAKSNSHASNSPIIAPNAQYGTPLSFTDFNTPAPVITYGAPNFGPPTTFVSTTTGFGGNLYNNVGDSVSNTYGTPVVNVPQSPVHSSGDCGSQKLQFTGSTPFNGDLGSYSVDLTGPAPSSLPTGPGEQQSLLTAPALPPVTSNALTNSYLPPPPVNELDLDSRDQPKTDLRDSYGNPIGVSIDVTSDADDLHSSSTGISKVIPVQSFSSQSRNVFPEGSSSQHGEGLSVEALTASLTAKGFAQPNNVNANEVDPSQFLKTQEGSEALALAERLTAEGANGFQIQGSKGTYMLQIQPADGGFGTENSDGSIRHDQVLSNGLLQDILAAIEQPDHGQAEQVQSNTSQDQSLQEVYGDLTRAASHNGVHLIRIGDQNQNEIQQIMTHASDRSEESEDDEKNSSKHEAIALFFNNGNRKDANNKNESNKFEDSKETRSVSKSEEQITVSGESQKSESKDTTS